MAEPIIERIRRIREQWGGPLILGRRLQALGLLAGSSPAPEKPREEFPMPEDYAGGPEEWQKLPESEKRAIYEALKQNRKIYVAKMPEEATKRGTLDNNTLERMRLQKLLSGW